MLFTRAAMTSAKCIRLVQMMGLDRLDGERDDLPPTLIPPTTWVEMEERRRTFWAAFSIDAHASISTGWPSLINSNDVSGLVVQEGRLCLQPLGHNTTALIGRGVLIWHRRKGRLP